MERRGTSLRKHGNSRDLGTLFFIFIAHCDRLMPLNKLIPRNNRLQDKIVPILLGTLRIWAQIWRVSDL